MLEGVPDAISAAAYGLGSDRVRETLSQLAVNANAGCGPDLGPGHAQAPQRRDHLDAVLGRAVVDVLGS